NFIATSDAMIDSGLIGMLLRVYNNATPEEILASNTDFIKQRGVGNNLSTTRANGLKSMIDYIYATDKQNQ
ncbi:SufE family protein, partial [Francisella tularensis subsp. holarctica]|uniref:SufE family protein n=1 Tax=Francisella tularensis TaxID=263 RepID=UPI002381A6C7